MKITLSNSGKYIATFIGGAVLATSVAVAGNSQQSGTIKACADNRTGALFL